MREELKNTDWHTYGLSISDYDYTSRLIKDLIKDRNAQIRTKVLELERQKTDSEAISDLLYYADTDNQFIWHFGIWRLQGIFEGLMKQAFFPDKKLTGLKSKLDLTRKITNKISSSDYEELLEWGKLRNALSHFPPEQYRPSLVNEDDFREYLALVKRVTSDLISDE
ncbi:MAG: hypothetical protein ABJ092_13020 [Gillisia sp.]